MFLKKRLFCTHQQQGPKWPLIKQVNKTNFTETLEQLKKHLNESDYVAISMQKTGSNSGSWQRVLGVDNSEASYFKAKKMAEKYQIFQFAVCPFSIKGNKVFANPYNFHLFPRDELNIGMPSYSFSCQSSYLTSMVREGFDFNACIYEGISYLSRAQELASRDLIGNPLPSKYVTKLSVLPTVADSIFVERIKSRVRNWRNAFKDANSTSEEALIKSLRKLILGSDDYGSRPSLSIDVCSDRQVQLTLEMLSKFFDDLVPLLVPDKSGGVQSVRIVLTSSKEDKEDLERELQDAEEKKNKRVRGFREVIDLISTSQKPVVAHNLLNDFTFIYSKFFSSLPSSVDDFKRSLNLAFPSIVDVNHLMKEVGPLKKVTSIPGAIAILKRRFFLPLEMEISHQDDGKIHGHNVLKITELFTKICSMMKLTPETIEKGGYTNTLSPCSLSHDHFDEDIPVWTNNPRKVNCNDLAFLWGFRSGLSAKRLKELLCGSHDVFSEDFDLRLLDKSCAVILFRKPGLSSSFLGAMDCGGISSDSLKDMISDGLRAAGYRTYMRVCMLGFWEVNLADSLDKAVAESECNEEVHSLELSEINWSNELVINLDDLATIFPGSSRQLIGFNTEIDEIVINRIWERAAEFLPALRGSSLKSFCRSREVRVGLRPYMPDGKPVIGPVPSLPNLFLAAGHEGEGLTLDLGTAEMVANMVLGNSGKVDDAPYDVQSRCC